MFTKSAIVLAILLGITSSSLAAATQRQQSPNAAWDYGAVPSNAAVATKHRQHSPNPTWDVYNGSGHYLGSDPDIHVRQELLRDQNVGD
jgi:hypothetical protein